MPRPCKVVDIVPVTHEKQFLQRHLYLVLKFIGAHNHGSDILWQSSDVHELEHGLEGRLTSIFDEELFHSRATL